MSTKRLRVKKHRAGPESWAGRLPKWSARGRDGHAWCPRAGDEERLCKVGDSTGRKWDEKILYYVECIQEHVGVSREDRSILTKVGAEDLGPWCSPSQLCDEKRCCHWEGRSTR